MRLNNYKFIQEFEIISCLRW